MSEDRSAMVQFDIPQCAYIFNGVQVGKKGYRD